MKKRYSKKENTIELYIENPFKQATKFFQVTYTLSFLFMEKTSPEKFINWIRIHMDLVSYKLVSRWP